MGVSVIDRFTYYTLDFLDRAANDINKAQLSVQDLFDFLNKSPLMSTAEYVKFIPLHPPITKFTVIPDNLNNQSMPCVLAFLS